MRVVHPQVLGGWMWLMQVHPQVVGAEGWRS